MKRRHATILTAVFGVLAFLLIVGLSLGAWFFASAFESVDADERAAAAAFDEVRQRFAGQEPVFDIGGDGDAVRRRRAPASFAAGAVQTLHIRHWDPDDDGLSTVTVPFWFLRLKAGPIAVSGHVSDLEVTVEDIERYGPALLVDHEGRDGNRLLIWTE